MTDARPTMRPAERSVPAISSVKQMPSAMISLVDDCVRISSTTRTCMNLRSLIQIITTSTSSARIIALFVKKVFAVLEEIVTSPRESRRIYCDKA